MPRASMSVSDALERRYSVRAFRNTPVPQAMLDEVFTLARQAPSNCNVQPCRVYVVSGASKEQLKSELKSAVLSGKPATRRVVFAKSY